MAFQLSPGVNVTEIDLSAIIPTVSTTSVAFVGEFRWGPCNEVTLVSSEDNLAKMFGKPDADNFVHFFQAANFLAYADSLRLVRAIAADATNAHAGSDVIKIENDHDYENQVSLSDFPGTDVGIARFPGLLGNGLELCMCASANAFKKTVTNIQSFDSAHANIMVFGPDTSAPLAIPSYIAVGTKIVVGSQQFSVTAIDSVAKKLTLDKAASPLVSFGTSAVIKWEFADLFGSAPGTSDYAASKGLSNDECHAIVVDTVGTFSGLSGLVLEKYSHLSQISTAKTSDGSNNFFRDAINQRSKYIRIIRSVLPAAPIKEVFVGAVNGSAISLQECELGFDLFSNPETVDISLVVPAALADAGEHYDLAKYVTENICEVRKDCVAFISPHMDSVVNIQDPGAAIIEDRENILSLNSSYAVMDCNWKYQYDKYNDLFRWVPVNGDIAGLCARTDITNNPWWSPAGWNRGLLKNVVKLAWSPDKSHRDDLYQAGVNPVIADHAAGFVLDGDKTLQVKASAFDRINVRRLFIVLEKAIAIAAKFMLFEFNDEFTRAQFRSMVDPYLRSVKGGRGIYDYRVVCDETNNTGDVIDRNEFVGDIYIKPARSINFIQLNFVAVRTGVAFEEVVGKF